MSINPCRAKWKGTMTDRKRFNNQMHYQSVDRCFNMEFGYWEENFSQWKIFKDNGVSNNNEADLFFNFDRNVCLGAHFWIWPQFTEKVIEETDTKKTVRNRDGLIAEVFKDGASTIPHFIGSSIKTPDDWKQIKEERFNPGHPDRKVDIETLKKKHPPDRDYSLGIRTGAMIGKVRDILSLEGLSYALADYPEMVEDMVEQSCLLVEHFLDQVLPHFEFDYAHGWEDICCNSGPLVSPGFFKNVVAPRYKRIGEKLHTAGVDIWSIDCDGDIRALLPTFLECGVNTMFPFEVNGCEHPGKLLDEYGKDLRIMGGVDKMELAKGPDAIKAYLESIAPYVERGGFIPFCDHRCPPNVREEDYLYYLDLKEAMFSSPSS